VLDGTDVLEWVEWERKVKGRLFRGIAGMLKQVEGRVVGAIKKQEERAGGEAQ